MTRSIASLVAGAGCLAAAGVVVWSARDGELSEPSADPLTFTADLPPIVATADVSPATFRVEVRHPGGPAAVFGPIARNCGCVAPDRPADRLAPGEAMTVTLGVSLAGRVGPVKVACWWPDDAGRTWTAAGRVTVYPRQEYDPPRVRLTGGVTRVDFHQHARDADGLPAPPAFDPATGWLSVVAEPPRVGRAEPGVLRWTTTLRLGARPESAPPAERAMAILHDREAAALLSVEYAVTPVATTYPARLAFLFAPGGPETLTQVIQVRGPGGLPPAVSAVRCDLAGVSVAVNESQLTVTAGATATAVVGSVRATAAGPAGPVTVTVPVSLAPRG